MALRIQLERGLNAPRTSSIGRLYDAVASLVGIRQTVNYEAQAAIEFEGVADPDEGGSYRFEVRGETVDPQPVIHALLSDIRAGIPVTKISARFHQSIAEMVCQICSQARAAHGSNDVVLSGGVWQNMLLLKKTTTLLHAEKFNLLIHRRVPANDGGLALGQALVAATNVLSNSV